MGDIENQTNILSERIKELSEKFKELKESGIDEDILISYLHDRTKLSYRNVRLMLECVDEFYEKLTSKIFLKALEK